MLVSQIRPVSEMPALELNTDMFLDLDPHEHYLAFALDDNGKSVLTQNMMDMLVQYPGVGELNNRPPLSASKIYRLQQYTGAICVAYHVTGFCTVFNITLHCFRDVLFGKFL